MQHGVLIAIACVTFAHALPDGPPLGACRDMQPRARMGETDMEGHTEEPQNRKPTQSRSAIAPYHINIHPMPINYEPNGQYNVFVTADQESGTNAYMGILLQARQVRCYGNGTIDVYEDTMGSFTVPSPPSSTLLQTLDCNGVEASAIGHKSRQFKINETATWHAPGSYAGHMVFWATIVQEDIVYWMRVNSSVMLDPNEPPPVPCACARMYVHPCMLSVMLLTVFQMLYERWIHR